MKPMEDYIREVYEKYEESEKNHQKYKTVKVKYHSPLSKLCGVAACVALILTVCIGVKYWNVGTNEEIKYVSSSGETEKETIVHRKYIWVDGNFDKTIKKAIKTKEYIAIVSEIEILDYGYEMRKSNLFIKVLREAKVNKVIKGELNKDSIKITKNCGKVSLKNLEKNEKEDWKTWELENLGKIYSEQEKDFVYYEQIPSRGTDFENAKQYLVFMDYNEAEDVYEINDYAYGILEYDPETKKVKNIDTGEFVEIDWSLIEQN